MRSLKGGREGEISDHLTCFLGNLYAGQEATVRTRHGTMELFKNGKGVHQGVAERKPILTPCWKLFDLLLIL